MKPLLILLALGAATGDATAQTRALPAPKTAERAALEAQWRSGALDAVALMAGIAGPLPLPNGARFVRCASTLDNLAFTLDRPPSITFMRHLYAMQIEAQRPVEATDKARGNPRPLTKSFDQVKEVVAGEGRPAHALIDRLRKRFEAAGYVRDLEQDPAIAYRHAQQVPFRTLLIGLSMQSLAEQQRCATAGERIEAGPMIRLRYATKPPLAPMELMEQAARKLEAGFAQMSRDVEMVGDD